MLPGQTTACELRLSPARISQPAGQDDTLRLRRFLLGLEPADGSQAVATLSGGYPRLDRLYRLLPLPLDDSGRRGLAMVRIQPQANRLGSAQLSRRVRPTASSSEARQGRTTA